MYIPKHFESTDEAAALAFMQRFSFATLVTVDGETPVATHLPFVAENRDHQIVLTTHLAKANPHAKLLGQEQLVIFQTPHAYISPDHYEKKQNVPTWNYLAVHAYGQAMLIESEPEVMTVLESMIGFYESAYMDQWAELSPEYKSNMAKGIVAFELVVNRIQHKEKLSQNKTSEERKSIVSSLAGSSAEHEQLVAEYMKKHEGN